MYYISWPERDDCLILFVISHGFCNNYLKGRQELHRNNPHHFHLLSQWQSHHIPAPTWQANMEIWVMSLKNNTQKVQLQNASNIKGRMMPQRCCMPVCCIFSEPNWNKSILLALHVFQARLWCICLGICAWCKGIGRFRGIVSGKKSLETDDFVIWVYECWILDLGNTNLFRHKNLYKFYIQIERGRAKDVFSILPLQNYSVRAGVVFCGMICSSLGGQGTLAHLASLDRLALHQMIFFLNEPIITVHVNLFDLIHLSCVSVT